MRFDYSKTINEQLPTFEYYKDRYCSYELELLKDRKEIERLKKENDFLKQLIPNEKKYSYGIRVGSDESDRNMDTNA